MADFKVEIEFDGDEVKLTASDLITYEKVTFKNTEQNAQLIKDMMKMSLILKRAFTLSGTI